MGEERSPAHLEDIHLRRPLQDSQLVICGSAGPADRCDEADRFGGANWFGRADRFGGAMIYYWL
jgi:hypothetical protein